MKGLLLKDWYTLTKQMKVFLLMIVLFACMPGGYMAGFAIVYASMLPMTAMAYDERSKWNTLAAMMPYSAAERVLCKYLLGYALTVGATLLSAAANTVMLMMGRTDGMSGYVSAVLMLFLALIMQSISLPVMFKVGVEKARLAFTALIAVMLLGTVGAFTWLGDNLPALDINVSLLLGGLGLLTVVANILSILIAVRVMKNKEV